MIFDDRTASGNAGHDHLAPARKAGHVVERDAAHQHRQIGGGEGRIERDRRAQRRDQPRVHDFFAVVAEPAVAGHHRAAEDQIFIPLFHGAVLSRGDDPRHCGRFVDGKALSDRRAHLGGAAPAARDVGHDDGDAAGAFRQFFQRGRTDGAVKRLLDGA